MVIALVPMLSASSSLARTDRVRPSTDPLPCRVSHARATARVVVVFPVPAGPMSALAACGFSSRYAAAFAWSSLSRFPPARMDWMSRVPSPGPQARGSARPNVAMTRFSMSRIVWLVYRSSVGSSNVLRPARLTSAGSSPACPAR